MLCPECGTKNLDVDAFCLNCRLPFADAVFTIRPNICGLLCYLFGWLSGIYFILVAREDNVIRFNAWQSIVTFGILTIPITVLNLLTLNGAVLYWSLVILYWVIVTFTLYLWILLMFRVYNGHNCRLYMVGNIALRLSKIRNINILANEEGGLSVGVGRSDTAAVKPQELKWRTQQDNTGLRAILNETVKSIMILCEIRDPYTAAHQQRVAQLACAISREMGFPDHRIEGIRITGVIHDIGKVAMPSEILSKPGKLSSYEFGIIKTHPEIAHDIVRSLEFPWPVAQAIFQHHERMDGSGYPKGLRAKEIILEARIIAVADIVETMASHRPYRPALGTNKALDEISQNNGTLYDPIVVDACLELFTEKRFKF